MQIRLMKLRPDLFNGPPQIITDERGYMMLRYEAPAIEETSSTPALPGVILYIMFDRPGRISYGYSYHWPDGLVEHWNGPFGDPDRDAHGASGVSPD